MREQLRTLTRSTLIYGLGQALGRALTKVALVPLLARAFVPAQFGAWDLVTTLAAILQLTFITGLDGGLNRLLGDQADDTARRRLVSTALAWRVGMSLLFCVPAAFASGPIARGMYGDPTLAPYLRVMFLSVPCTLAVMFVSDFLRMTFRPWAFLSFTLLNSLVYALMVVLGVTVRHSGVTGVLAAQLVTDSVFALVGLWLLRPVLTRRWSGGQLKSLLHVGLPFLPIALSYWVIQYADRNFLVRFRGYNELGIYGAAAKVALIMTFGVQAFTLAWPPLAFAHAREEGAPRLFARVMGLYIWVGAALAVFLSVFAREILGVGTTRAYVGGQGVAPMLVYASLLNGLYYIFIIGITMARRTGVAAQILVGAAVLTLALNYLWARSYGMYGVGAATLLGYLATTVLVALYSRREFPCPYPLGRAAALLLWAGAISALGCAMPAWALGTRLALKLALVLAYLAGSALSGLVRRNDFASVGALISGRIARLRAGTA